MLLNDTKNFSGPIGKTQQMLSELVVKFKGAICIWPSKSEKKDEAISPFTAEAPIRSAGQDTLGRVEFATNLANIISRWRNDTSLVIAIRSPWGNGKTSVKNLVLEQLEKSSPKVGILQFNPWQYPNAEAITVSFYRELRIALGKKSESFNSWEQKRLIRKYSRYFTSAGSGLNAIGKQATLTLTTMSVLGLSTFGASFFTQVNMLRWGSLFVAAIGFGGLIADFLGFIGKAEEQVPQEHVRSELEGLLRKLKHPLLIVIDDLDRLDQEAIRMIIRHVKVNADLPNITYLLLFQREIVEAALDEITNQQGREYLDKIILAPFDLPPVDRERMEKVLFGEIDKFILEIPNNGFEHKRWSDSYQGGLKYYFRNLRDVHRFIASLQIQITLHMSKNTLEINIIDIFILETIRLFEPQLYNSIANNKVFLTGAENLAVVQKEKAQSLLQGAINEEAAKSLLIELFPILSTAFNGQMFFRDNSSGNWAKSRRVAIDHIFNRYFCLRVPDNTITSAEVEALLEHAGDRDYIDMVFADLRQRGLLGSLMSRLDEIHDHLPSIHIETLAGALFDIGDDLDDEVFFSGQGSYVACWRAASRYFHNIKDVEERSKRFLATLNGSAGLAVPSELIRLEDRRRKTKDLQRLILTDADWHLAKSLWFEKLKAALVEPRSVIMNPHFLEILYTARDLDKTDEIKAWVAHIILDPTILIQFLQAFVSTSNHWIGGEHEVRPTLSIKHLQNFTDLNALSAELSALEKPSLTSEELSLIAEFERRRHEPIVDTFENQ